MQIDFHHAVTYILARWAGFDHSEAETIAYAAQYVDDATNEGWLEFASGQRYYRIASSHETYDVFHHLNKKADAHTWIPFHFLPGNAEDKTSTPDAVPFSERLLCVKNSKIANEMVKQCILDKSLPFGGLHRLGITMHVFADTFTHYDFCGTIDHINSVENFNGPDESGFGAFTNIFIPDLGHGEVRTNPDLPYVSSWGYTKQKQDTQNRNNTENCLDAASAMLQAMRQYRNGNPLIPANGLDAQQREHLEGHFQAITGINDKNRHRDWLNLLNQGKIDGISENVRLTYTAKGANSWKERKRLIGPFLRVHWA